MRWHRVEGHFAGRGAVLVDMRRRRIAPLVLFALLVGLAGGPHPCHANPAKSARLAMPSMPHCPAMGMAANAGPVVHGPARGCCDLPGSGPGDTAQCEQTCSLLAVLDIAPALSPLGLSQALAVPGLELRLSLFAPSIDHIPL